LVRRFQDAERTSHPVVPNRAFAERLLPAVPTRSLIRAPACPTNSGVRIRDEDCFPELRGAGPDRRVAGGGGYGAPFRRPEAAALLAADAGGPSLHALPRQQGRLAPAGGHLGPPGQLRSGAGRK